MRLRIVVCECGKHGHFVGRDGRSDLYFCSQQEAWAILTAALQRGELQQATVWKYLHMVQTSGLPEDRQDVDPRTKDEVHQWVLMCATTNDPDGLSPEQFHDFFPKDD